MRIRTRMGLAAAACALFTGAQVTEVSADLNLSSSTTVQCVGGSGAYAAMASCEVLRFTLNIPDPQVPISVTSPAVAGQVYSAFGVQGFSLQTFMGNWAFSTLMNATPGTWGGELTQSTWQIYSAQSNSTATGGFVPPPITFDVRMSAWETELINLQMQYSANGFGVGPNTVGVPNATHAWSAGGLVSSTVPEPASMILLGTGLMGLAGVARRRRRNNDVENA